MVSSKKTASHKAKKVLTIVMLSILSKKDILFIKLFNFLTKLLNNIV